MRHALAGRLPLLPAPVLALAATLVLVALGPQADVVMTWGLSAALVCAVPLVAPNRYVGVVVWSCAALLAAGVVISILSIGAFFVPAVIALVFQGIFAPAAHGD